VKNSPQKALKTNGIVIVYILLLFPLKSKQLSDIRKGEISFSPFQKKNFDLNDFVLSLIIIIMI
jgi:hypothetical protein